jgi:hypothetical protein
MNTSYYPHSTNLIGDLQKAYEEAQSQRIFYQ